MNGSPAPRIVLAALPCRLLDDDDDEAADVLVRENVDANDDAHGFGDWAAEEEA
jgi:hypothetical protein